MTKTEDNPMQGSWNLGTQIGEPNGGKSVRGGDHFVPRLRVRWRKLSAVM
jgi:hypothetical protein